MAKDKKEIEIQDSPEAADEEKAPMQMPDGSEVEDEEKYAKAWLALGGGLCALMGDDAKMHSFDPFVSIVWKDRMLLQLPADFVEDLTHKFTVLQWQVHNLQAGGPEGDEEGGE